MMLRTDPKSCILSISAACRLGTFNNVTNVTGIRNEYQVLIESINYYHCRLESEAMLFYNTNASSIQHCF